MKRHMICQILKFKQEVWNDGRGRRRPDPGLYALIYSLHSKMGILFTIPTVSVRCASWTDFPRGIGGGVQTPPPPGSGKHPPENVETPPKKIGNPPEISLIFNIPNYSLD